MLDQVLIDKKEQMIQEELEKIELEERKRLNIPKNKIHHWRRYQEPEFYASEKDSTTILIGGLTKTHDYFAKAALKGLGYQAENLGDYDNEALRYGKEFCNRALCNPAYFTIGNLIRFLTQLRDEQGMSVEEIKKKYVLLTAGSCGPCRFGMYEAEYRKALEDSGFAGFRILTFQQKVETINNREKLALEINLKFYTLLIKALVVADILNTFGYRLRPYEVNQGETDKVLQECADMFYQAFVKKRRLYPIFWKVRKKIAGIQVNFLNPKPVVDIIGEFWAMTTDGDGNYRMQRWLEQEGAEVRVQKIINWVQYIVFENEQWFNNRINLAKHDDRGLKNYDNPKKAMRMMRLGERLLKLHYHAYCWFAGLKKEKLADMKKIAQYASPHYNTNLSGGEGHMEVGKLIKAAKEKEAHMVLSIKPFGCMPSACVSDGVQSKIQELYPSVVFYPIETSGDNAANIYSRVQMMLFKAKKNAKEEFDHTLSQLNVSFDDLKQQYINKKKFQNGLYKSPHREANSASNVAHDLIK